MILLANFRGGKFKYALFSILLLLFHGVQGPRTKINNTGTFHCPCNLTADQSEIQTELESRAWEDLPDENDRGDSRNVLNKLLKEARISLGGLASNSFSPLNSERYEQC